MSRRRVRRTVLATAVVAVTFWVGIAVWADDAPTSTDATPRSTTTVSSTTTTTAPTTTLVPPTTTPAATTTAAVDVFALRPPAAAGDPAGLAGQIVYAETVLRDPAAAPGPVGEAALAQQVAYRQLGLHPEWDEAVLAAVPEAFRTTVMRNAYARREFRAMHRTLSTTLPAWRIVPPEPLENLKAAYLEAEAAFGVPWPYFAAIHLVETGMGRIRGTSSAGAQGPMQFLPATWAAYGGGGDINSTRDAILGAGRYLAANGGAANIPNALWNYNHSDHYVRGVQVYAELISEYPEALRAYYHWGVQYLTASGDVFLPVGYPD
jgi:membrane-bound lytic murein transglycosylase B